MTRELVEEMEELGIVERVRDLNIDKADPSKRPSLITLTKEFVVFLYEAKKSPTESNHGDIGITALKLDRYFIGIERDPKRLEIAKANIEDSCIIPFFT